MDMEGRGTWASCLGGRREAAPSLQAKKTGEEAGLAGMVGSRDTTHGASKQRYSPDLLGLLGVGADKCTPTQLHPDAKIM